MTRNKEGARRSFWGAYYRICLHCYIEEHQLPWGGEINTCVAGAKVNEARCTACSAACHAAGGRDPTDQDRN
jgi:hypothetical protein